MDDARLRAAMADDAICMRGLVQEIHARPVVAIALAVVVRVGAAYRAQAMQYPCQFVGVELMNKPLTVLLTTALLIQIALIVGLWKTHDNALDGLRRDLTTVSAKVDEQTVVVSRALGNVLPYKLPDQTVSGMQSIQDRIAAAIRSPVDRTAIEKMRSDLAGIVEMLPPWAQEEVLPTLVPLRWDLEALWILGGGTIPDDELPQYSETLDFLIAGRPVAASDALAEKLEAAGKAAELRIAAADRSVAFASAQSASADGASTDQITAAIQLLNAHDDDEARSAAIKLTQRLDLQLARDNVNALQTNFDKYKSMKDGPARQHGLDRTYEAAIDLHMRLVAAGVPEDSLYKALEELESASAAAASESRAARMKDYQVWALSQIRQVKTFEQFKKELGSPERARWELREAMTKYLAPIDEGLLDVAVGQTYRNAYANRFPELADDGKVKLVTAFANTPKRSPDTLP